MHSFTGGYLVAIEIERKFLVEGTEWRKANGTRICQGYLNRDKDRTVRVRVAGEHAYLTVKGTTQGATRAEFEYEIQGENAGLVVAEIALQSEDQAFARPPWIGREVTGDHGYFNSNLATKPYGTWREQGDLHR